MCEPIKHGQKIKWVYLSENPFGIESIAMKGDETDADKMMEFINQYVDRKAMFESELKSKMIEFYNVFGWQFPNASAKLAEFFFG